MKKILWKILYTYYFCKESKKIWIGVAWSCGSSHIIHLGMEKSPKEAACQDLNYILSLRY